MGNRTRFPVTVYPLRCEYASDLKIQKHTLIDTGSATMSSIGLDESGEAIAMTSQPTSENPSRTLVLEGMTRQGALTGILFLPLLLILKGKESRQLSDFP